MYIETREGGLVAGCWPSENKGCLKYGTSHAHQLRLVTCLELGMPARLLQLHLDIHHPGHMVQKRVKNMEKDICSFHWSD